jgi:superfamily II DNA or RNA helicase
MKIKPREHQRIIADDFIKSNRKDTLIWLGTGAGKTILFYLLTQELKDKRFLFIAPQIELVHQTRRVGHSLDIDSGILQGNKRQGLRKRIVVASLQTIGSRLKHDKETWANFLKKFDCVVFDEAHDQKPTVKAVADLIEQGQKIYMSATPYDGKGRQLDHLRKAHILGKQFGYQYMVEKGYLVPVSIRVVKAVSDAGLKVKGDDFASDKEVLNFIAKHNIDIVEHMEKHLIPNSPTVVVCRNIEHAEDTLSSLLEAGYNADIIHSRVEGKAKDKLEAFKKGDVDVLVSVAMLTTGIDVPQIGNIVLASPIASKPKYIQTVGRGLRIADNKPFCRVLDLFGASVKFGHPFKKITIKAKDGDCPKCKGELYLSKSEVQDGIRVSLYKCLSCDHTEIKTNDLQPKQPQADTRAEREEIGDIEVGTLDIDIEQLIRDVKYISYRTLPKDIFNKLIRGYIPFAQSNKDPKAHTYILEAVESKNIPVVQKIICRLNNVMTK